MCYSGLDQRLRKRGAASLPGPRTDELGSKRACVAPAPATLAPVPAGGPALAPPALGTAGPIVRTAGALRLQV